MEHDDFDKKFRDLIQNDNSELNEQERLSKEVIWEDITASKKERKIFPFWQIAAAVLLLLLGGTSWLFSNKINLQEQYYAELQKELLETKSSLQIVQQKFIQSESTNLTDTENNTIPKINQPKEVVEILKKEYIENVVYVRDTVFLESIEKIKESIRLVRDTVFIEVPAKQPTRLVDLEMKEETLKEKFSNKKKKSKKIEFVFGKKPLEKPVKKNPLILINEAEVAKKPNNTNKSNVFTIPINNN